MTTTTIHDTRIESKMASQDGQEKTTRRLPVGGYLFTPPENTADSFSQQEDSKDVVVEWRKTVLPPIVQTPPASPEFSTLPDIASATGYPTHDTPLFPDQTSSDRTRPQAQLPLFEKERTPSPSPVRASADARSPKTASTSLAAKPSKPLPFPANLHIKTGQDALRYYYARMEELRQTRPNQLPHPRKSPSSDLDNESIRQLQSLTKPGGVTKSRSAPRTIAKPKAPLATSPVRTSPPKRRTPKARTYSDFVDSAFPQKESSTKHKRAPPSKKVEGENVNWTDLPDYCPPSSDLDTNPKTLKVTWHGHALPLSDDPGQVHLHEQEIQVASTLRLSCAVYLTNKRKIFQAKLQTLKDGKNFTKTAAQSACKIDVNKASQLWEAFDRVGWFNSEWYKQYL